MAKDSGELADGGILKAEEIRNLKGSQGTIQTYDITDRSSFTQVIEWMNEVEKNPDCLIAKMLIGNKKEPDSQREVSYGEGKELADAYSIKFTECSAKQITFIINLQV